MQKVNRIKYKGLNASISIIHMILVVGICFIILYPLLVKLSVAFMPEEDLFDPGVIFLPHYFSLDAVKIAIQYMNYGRVFFNTAGISLTAALLQTASCTLVGYGFARFDFPTKKLWTVAVILTLVVPPQTVLLPTYVYFHNFGLINNVASIGLLSALCVGFKNGLFVLIMRQYFRGLPKELEEAAYVDGAGTLHTFLRIMLPGALAMMLTIFLFSFIWQWTDIYYSSFFFTKLPLLSTNLLSLGARIARNDVSLVNPRVLSQIVNVGSLLVVAPLLVLYAFTQKYFVEGVERSGIVE